MNFIITAIAVYVVAFLLGSIPCGVIIGKTFYGVDPRSGGSHSIGATNSSRMMGLKGGIIVMVCDMLKGVIAVVIARVCIMALGLEGAQADALLMGSAFFGIMGHCYSPWLHFKGGKGISTGFGVLVVASPPIGIGILVVFAIFAVATRIVSVGSMAAAISVTVFALVFHWGSVPFFVFGLLCTIQVLFAHRANIGRLMRGEEPKFTGKKTKGE